MKKRRLIESLEMQISVPDPGYHMALENMLAEWCDTPYPELSVILVHLRFLAQVHQAHHWTARGDAFYGDHQMFMRLYEQTTEEIDGIAEKAVGLGCVDNVNLTLQLQQIAKLAHSYGMASTIPQSTELSKRSMIAEVSFLRCVSHCAQSLKEKGLMTRGLDNMLAGIEDVHEGHVYLLKQRCMPSP